ncbi:hypothetical protein LCGC14_1240010 [marine sediment metagenome]|uniref:Uncharacterized protein n=1 Tax=marine sediment metagenome TaxID=412755 RepID=A0A0F9NNC1_9ZZZZ
MIIAIRRLENTEHEYFAYTKSICGKGTYFVYFQDNIFGALTLHNFVEMLRSFFKPNKLEVTIHEKELSIKSEYLLQVLKE